MINAKEELLKILMFKKPVCAYITHVPFDEKYGPISFALKKGYSQEDWEQFLTQLDFEYDNGYGTQELFGTIWMSNEVWLDRHEYDGSEYWEWQAIPEIPEELL